MPFRICIHTKNSVIDNKEEVFNMIREVTKYVSVDDERIAPLKNIGNLSPPAWMSTVSTLRSWRCTADREYLRNTTIPVDRAEESVDLPLPHMNTPIQSIVQVMTLQPSDEDTYQGQSLESDNNAGHPVGRPGGAPSPRVGFKSKQTRNKSPGWGSSSRK